MKIRDQAMLDRFRGPDNCELCCRYCQEREPHHVRTVGSGGSDIAINLVAVGSTRSYACGCHAKYQGGADNDLHVRRIIADREKTTAAAIEEAVWAIVALDKTPTDASMRRHVSWRSPEVRQLVCRSLAERSL